MTHKISIVWSLIIAVSIPLLAAASDDVTRQGVEQRETAVAAPALTAHRLSVSIDGATAVSTTGPAMSSQSGSSATPLFSGRVSKSQLIKNVRAVAGNSATRGQMLGTMFDKKRVDSAFLRGEIPGDVYSRWKYQYEKTGREWIARTGRRTGIVTGFQPAKPAAAGRVKAGGDIDGWLTGTVDGKPLTVGDAKRFREEFGRVVNEEAARFGQAPLKRPAVKMEIDGMVVPGKMAPGHWEKNIDFMRGDGVVMYADPAAVKVEMAQRQKGAYYDSDDLVRYSKEMQHHVDHTGADARRHYKQGSAMKQSGDAAVREMGADYQAYSDLERMRQGKYLKRQVDAANRWAKKKGIPVTQPESKAWKSVEAVDSARTAKEVAEGHAEIVRRLETHLGQVGVEHQIDKVAEWGFGAPAANRNRPLVEPISDKAAENIGKLMQDLPPAKQGEVIRNIETRYGKKAARRVVRKAKDVAAQQKAEGSRPGAGQLVLQGAVTGTMVAGKMSNIGSRRLREGNDLTAGDGGEVLLEGARSIPEVGMVELVGKTAYDTTSQKSRAVMMMVEEKEQALKQAQRILAMAEHPAGPCDPQEIQAARQQVAAAQKAVDDARRHGAQDLGDYFNPNQQVVRMFQGKDTVVSDLASNTAGAARDVIVTPLEKVIRKNLDEMDARAKKEGRRPTMQEGAEFMAKSGYDYVSEFGGRQAGESLYNITSQWAADRAEIGAQKELGQTFDRRFSYHESRLNRIQRDLDQLVTKGDASDPKVQLRKEALLSQYRSHYDTIQKIPDLAGRYLGDFEWKRNQINTAMKSIHTTGNRQDLDETLKDPAKRDAWANLIEARRRLEAQAAQGGGLNEADRQRLANYRRDVQGLADPNSLREYVDGVLPGPRGESAEAPAGESAALLPTNDVAASGDTAGGGFAELSSDKGASDPELTAQTSEGAAVGQTGMDSDSRAVMPDSNGGFGEIGQQGGRVESGASGRQGTGSKEFAEVGDAETREALAAAAQFRRTHPGRPAWEKYFQVRQQQNRQRQQEYQQDLARALGDMATVVGQIATGGRTRPSPSPSQPSLSYSLTPPGPSWNPKTGWGPPGARSKMPPRSAGSSSASARYTPPSSSPAPSPSPYQGGQIGGGVSSGTGGGMSWDACVNKYCPECANAISLMDLSASDPCNDCKRRKNAQISQCASAKSSVNSSSSSQAGGAAFVGRNQTFLNTDEGPKVYYAARRYQSKYKNYHYVIGKTEFGGLQGYKLMHGPDSFLGCRRWLVKKGHWKK